MVTFSNLNKYLLFKYKQTNKKKKLIEEETYEGKRYKMKVNRVSLEVLQKELYIIY